MLAHDALHGAESGTSGERRGDPTRLANALGRGLHVTRLLAVLDGGEALRRHVFLPAARRAGFCDDGNVLEAAHGGAILLPGTGGHVSPRRQALGRGWRGTDSGNALRLAVHLELALLEFDVAHELVSLALRVAAVDGGAGAGGSARDLLDELLGHLDMDVGLELCNQRHEAGLAALAPRAFQAQHALYVAVAVGRGDADAVDDQLRVVLQQLGAIFPERHGQG